jgi:cysteinyl-tRNA synthetase
MIQTLVDSGYAYVGENGDVFYSVRKFPQYGRLSGKKLDELQSGERIAVDDNKQDPLDFVLWKTAKPGEPSWPSFWGNGRPGWHIECSAMATHCLGNHFDIHGGGLDLQFPHHENEIAQSEAATHEKFVNVWMHNGFVRVDDEKMSKSLGNFFTIRDVLKSYDPEVLRFFILASHYRKPLNYSDVQLDNAKAGLSTLYMALRNMGPIPAAGRPEEIDQAYQDRFDQAMNDDFNTAEAIAVLFDIAKACNREKLSNSRQAKVLATTLRSLSASLGLLQREADTFFQSGLNSEVGADIGADDIEKQIAARDEAKKNRDWAKSDEIRDALTARGVVLEDGPTGTTWRRQ